MRQTRSRILLYATLGLLIAMLGMPVATGQLVRDKLSSARDVDGTGMDAGISQTPSARQRALDNEVLLGGCNCFPTPDVGTIVNVDFRSTGNIVTPGLLDAQNGFPPSSADCTSARDLVRQQLTALDCTVTPDAGDPPIQSFRFVCEGTGAAMAHVVAEVHRAVLTIR